MRQRRNGAPIPSLAEDERGLDAQIDVVVLQACNERINHINLGGRQQIEQTTEHVEVTVLLAVRQKVVANFAYRPGELKDDAIDGIIAALPKIVTSGK